MKNTFVPVTDGFAHSLLVSMLFADYLVKRANNKTLDSEIEEEVKPMIDDLLRCVAFKSMFLKTMGL